MVRDRIAAVIIKDKKILLVTGYKGEFYWTPGGKIEENESHELCLRRELKDELSINIISLKHYASYNSFNDIEGEMQNNYCYLVQYEGELKPREEITGIFWYSNQDFLDKSIRVSKGVQKLIPKLLQDEFL
jgi:ADP-ribose pyrophosphatase YjhB (NUDIX family)